MVHHINNVNNLLTCTWYDKRNVTSNRNNQWPYSIYVLESQCYVINLCTDHWTAET